MTFYPIFARFNLAIWCIFKLLHAPNVLKLAYTYPHMNREPIKKGGYCHVYNRGVDKRSVFSEPADYKRFLAYLYLLNTEEDLRANDIIKARTFERILTLPRQKPLVAIGAYCLLPTHFRGYATPLVRNGVSRFMQRVQTAYTMYFNRKYKRIGALFQSTFKSRHIKDELDARFLLAFMHLLPISLVDPEWKDLDRGELIRFEKDIAGYPYSSIGEYLSGTFSIVNPSGFPALLSPKHRVDDHVTMWLRARNEYRSLQRPTHM